jgi:hypothetical protein
MSYYEKIQKQDTTIIFEELDIPPLLALNNGIKTSIAVHVYQDKKFIARYYRDCSFEFTDVIFQIFIQRFLSSSNFRAKLQHLGEWNGKYKTSKKESINKACAEAIEYINSLESPTTQDFIRLKTFGKDSFSSQKRKDMISSLAIADIRRIQNEFKMDIEGQAMMLSAIRWISRGLKVEYAIRKIRVDEKVAKIAAERYR